MVYSADMILTLYQNKKTTAIAVVFANLNVFKKILRLLLFRVGNSLFSDFLYKQYLRG